MVSFLIDAILAVMLITATGFLIVVNKRLKLLRSSQSELNDLIMSFSRTIDETDASVKRLVGAASEISGKLAGDLDRAKAMHEEATLLLGSCERATKRMEESAQLARSLARRLEEGTLTKLRPPASAKEARKEMAARERAASEPPSSAIAAVATPAPVAPDDAEPTDATALDADGFKPLSVPALSTQPDVEQPVDDQNRQLAVGAFYARLRTVGAGG